MGWGGYFAGGLVSGLGAGMKLGKMITDTYKEAAADDVRAKGMEEAKAAREEAINGSIQEGGSPAATTGITGKTDESYKDSPNYVSMEKQNQISGGKYPDGGDPMTADKPVVAPTASIGEPSAPTPGATPGEGAKAIVQDPAQAITPQSQPKADEPKPGEEKVAQVSQSSASIPKQEQAQPNSAEAKPAAANGLPFVVAGKGYATREEARKAAEKNAPSVMDMMSKTMVPRMQEHYMRTGEIDKAEAWGKWAEDRENKAAMKEWGSAYRAASVGNMEKAADHVFNLYKRYDDGVTPLSKETVKDKDGNVTGFNVRLKNDKTGEEYAQFVDKKSLTEMGLTALSPPKMFELQYQRQAEADKARAANASEIAKENRAFQRDVAKEDRKFGQQKEMKGIDQENAIEKMTIEKQLEASNASTKVKREVGAKVSALRDAGYSDEFINGAMPGIIGVGDYKKATSPEEARRLAHSDRMKNDMTYSRKSAAEQQAILDQDMKLIFGGVKPTQAPAGAPPAAGGLPSQAAPAKKGIPVWDNKTGTIVYK